MNRMRWASSFISVCIRHIKNCWMHRIHWPNCFISVANIASKTKYHCVQIFVPHFIVDKKIEFIVVDTIFVIEMKQLFQSFLHFSAFRYATFDQTTNDTNTFSCWNRICENTNTNYKFEMILNWFIGRIQAGNNILKYFINISSCRFRLRLMNHFDTQYRNSSHGTLHWCDFWVVWRL